MKTQQQRLIHFTKNLLINWGFDDANIGMLNDMLFAIRIGFPSNNLDIFEKKIKELPNGGEAILGTNDSFLIDRIKSIDLQSDFLETLAKNDKYQSLVICTSSEELPAARVKFGKLIPLTNSYLKHLKKQASELQGEPRIAIDKKIELVTKLDNCLDQSIPDSQIIKQFFTLLNESEKQLVQHRDPTWQRYVRNVLIAGAILITGILPGLLALAIYVNVRDSDEKSYRFWQSAGENIVNKMNSSTLQEEDIAKKETETASPL
jgi:hypothetical protein